MEKQDAKNDSNENNDFTLAGVLEKLIADFPSRSQEIIWSRFGIKGGKSLTLEEIGSKFGITRERVRQVIREVCRKIKMKGDKNALEEVRKKIIFTLDENSGIIKEESLLEKFGKNNKSEIGAGRFFIDCLDEVREVEVKGELLKSVALPEFEIEKWKKVKDLTLDVLMQIGHPVAGGELYKKIQQNNDVDEISKKTLFNLLSVSAEIKKNNFGKWGISNWKEISPKGTRDKAYLVLKESGKPLHFKEIAKAIDEYGLNRKKTHPQTVHNELIKDKKFILVGRGIYALSEWGYTRGTVKDVLDEIVGKNPGKYTKDDIIEKVLQIRQVKKSTIVINLNNYFKKNKEGKYTVK